MIEKLTTEYGLSTKDAGTLLSLNDGNRLDYFFDVMARLQGSQLPNDDKAHLGKIAGNWYAFPLSYSSPPTDQSDRVLMELGSLFKDTDFSPSLVTAAQLASIIIHLQRKAITSRSAKKLLLMKFEGDARPMKQIIEEENLALVPLSRKEYKALATTLLEEKPNMVKDIMEKGQAKKIKWFVGQMMARSREGSVEPEYAEEVLKELLNQ